MFHIVGLARPLHVRHGGSCRNQGLHDYGLDVPFELLLVFVFVLQLLPEPLEVSLAPLPHLVVVFGALILLEIG